MKSRNGVFCDYLTCTFNPANSPRDRVLKLLKQLPFPFMHEGKYGSSASGVISITETYGVDRLSFSGAAMETFSSYGSTGDLLAELIEHPYNLTRIDLARDSILQNAPAVIQRFAGLASQGSVSLSRKKLLPSDCKKILSWNDDDEETGTVYFGSIKSRYSAKVYDKTEERKSKGFEIEKGVVRVEVTARKNTASLRDVLDPDPLFYKLASPDLLPLPVGVPSHERVELQPLDLPKAEPMTSYQRMTRILDESPDLIRLRAMLENCTDAERRLLRGRLMRMFDTASHPQVSLVANRD